MSDSTVPQVATLDEQLRLWVDGQSTHLRTRDSYECCPDFSCCEPELQQPENIRRAFLASDEPGRAKWLRFFLDALISKVAPDRLALLTGKKVCVMGGS